MNIDTLITDPALRNAFAILRVVFIAADVILVFSGIYAFVKSLEYRPSFSGDVAPQKKVLSLQVAVLRERWQAIVKRFKAGVPESTRLAIIEADAFVDDILKRMGLPGEHMADRMTRLSPDEVTTLERLWRAHKLRNDLVHTPGFGLSPADAQAAMRDYEAFLNEMSAI
ncbi:MAG: hypothetical protein AAB759_02635 [Patescibacteria group bacterium]